jgi:hypothetical protein
MASLTIRLNDRKVRIPISERSRACFESRHKNHPLYKTYLSMILRGTPISDITKIWGVTPASVYANYENKIQPYVGKSIMEFHKEKRKIKTFPKSLYSQLHKSTRLIWKGAIKHKIKPEMVVYCTDDKIHTDRFKLILNGILCKIHFITVIRRPNGNNPYAVTTLARSAIKHVRLHIFVFVNNKHRSRIFIIPTSHINCTEQYRAISLPLAKAEKPRHKLKFPVAQNPIRTYENAWHYIFKS